MQSGQGLTPFIHMSLGLGASWAHTIEEGFADKTRYFALDARLGTRASWNFNDNTFPYFALRVFGGPVKWELDGEDVTGTDTHHYQLAFGTAVQYGPVGLYAEVAPLGEQSVSAGLSTSW